MSKGEINNNLFSCHDHVWYRHIPPAEVTWFFFFRLFSFFVIIFHLKILKIIWKTLTITFQFYLQFKRHKVKNSKRIVGDTGHWLSAYKDAGIARPSTPARMDNSMACQTIPNFLTLLRLRVALLPEVYPGNQKGCLQTVNRLWHKINEKMLLWLHSANNIRQLQVQTKREQCVSVIQFVRTWSRLEEKLFKGYSTNWKKIKQDKHWLSFVYMYWKWRLRFSLTIVQLQHS